MNPFLKQTISNDFPSLKELMRSAGVFLEEKAVDPQAAYRINLVLEEMVTNIIKYGYDKPRRHEIRVLLEIRNDDVVVLIEDEGHEFNPLMQPEKEMAVPLEKREVGGLGIHLIRKLLDHIDYRRENGKNILEIRTRRQFPASPA